MQDRGLTRRRLIGWAVTACAVAAMVLGNFAVSTPLGDIFSNLASTSVLALGLAMAFA
jgi:hypothetical protein